MKKISGEAHMCSQWFGAIKWIQKLLKVVYNISKLESYTNFLKKINKINRPLATLMKKREKNQTQNKN